jgi:integrase/recombinase XerD
MRDRMQVSGYAQSSTISYMRGVRDLMEHTGKVPTDLTEIEVISHLNEYREMKQLSASALNTRIFGILYYYREVVKDRKIKLDIPNPGRSKVIGDILTHTEVKTLLAACHYPKQRAVLALLYDTGLRANEVARLRIHDFDKKNGVLYVRFGKGGKHRVVPYGVAVVTEALKAYFEQEKPTDWLFEGATPGEPMTVKTVQYMVREAHKRTAIRKNVHPHVLRHTFAVHYLNNGGSLTRLQQLLGHGHLSTTLIYLRYAAIPMCDIDTPLDVLLGVSRERK